MTIKKIIFLALFVLGLNYGFGQHKYNTWLEGKIVLKTDDTLNGFIKVYGPPGPTSFSSSQEVGFKSQKESKAIDYGIDQIKKVIYKSSEKTVHLEYIRISIKRRILFEPIVIGKCTLYKRTAYGRDGHSHNLFYALRNKEDIAHPLIAPANMFFSVSFKKNAIEYFNDCAKLVSKLKNKTLKKRDIITIVEEYNKCE